MKKCLALYKGIIAVLMIVFMLYLTVMSLLFNAIIPLDAGLTEKTNIESAFWPLTILSAAAVLFWLAKRHTKIGEWNSEKILKILILYDFIACMLWIALSSTREGADQAQVLYAAQQFSYGNFDKLAPDRYMGMNPYQLPLALLYEPFYRLFGETTPFLWQFINAGLICLIQYLIYRIVCMVTDNRECRNLLLLLQFLDLPLVLYVAFVYGTLPGLALSLLAIYLPIRERAGRKWRDWVLSAVCMVLACLLRNNNLIFMIAVSLAVCAMAAEKRKAYFLLYIVAITVGFLGGRFLINQVYELRSGMTVCKGQPSTLYIAMGLSENEERANGWYNGYTWDTYLELGYDREAADRFAREKIGESLKKMGGSFSYTAGFFSEKINSTWLNPDFQGFWNNDHHGHYAGYSPFINELFTGNLHKAAETVLGVIQFIIYFGTLLYFVLCFKEVDWKKCTFALIFIGGFLFHLMWETKAQYVIVYYVLLFPYAAVGLLRAACRLERMSCLRRQVQSQ